MSLGAGARVRSSETQSHLVRLVGSYRRRLVAASALAVIQSILVIVGPWPLKLAIDNVVDGQRATGFLAPLGGLSVRSLATVAAVATVVIVVASGLVSYAQTMIVGTLAERLGAEIRTHVVDDVLARSGTFHHRFKTGDLVSRVTSDVGRFQDAIVAKYTVLFPEAVTLVGMVAVLMSVDLPLGLMGMSVLPLLSFVVVRRRRLIRATQRVAREESGALAALSTDLVRNARIVGVFNQNRQVMAKFAERNDAVVSSTLRGLRVDAGYSPLADLTLALGSALVLWVGLLRVIDGKLTTGTLLIVLSYVGSVYSPIRSLARLSTTIARGAASRDRIEEVLDTGDELVRVASPMRASRLSQGLVLRDLEFAYEPGMAVLRGISAEINAREHYCILGPSGAGKSTLTQLLVRFYDPSSGSILLDGVDIRYFDLTSYRDRLGVALQDPWILDASLAENIAFGCPEASRDVIRAAGTLAMLDGFASQLPHGYDSMIGEDGMRLSGGQRRRVALARAFLRAPDILILDEPTSGLDVETEQAILDSIEVMRAGGSIVITVTHRLAVAERASQVAVMVDGRIVQHGRPAQIGEALDGYDQLWTRTPLVSISRSTALRSAG